MVRVEIDRIREDKAGRKSKHFINIPFFNKVEIAVKSLSVVNHYLKGTDSDEWLTVAEDNIYKRMKGVKNAYKN